MKTDTPDLTETQLDSETVFKGRLMHVKRDRVRLPNGGESTREYLIHPGAVVVIPVFENGDVLLERQHRYPLHRDFIEFPAGKIDPNESDLTCAQRELQEETGFAGSHWRHLGTMHPCIGYSNERIEIFLATGLTHVGDALDDGEFLEIVRMSLADAREAVFDGRITDAKTITALFWAERELGAA